MYVLGNRKKKVKENNNHITFLSVDLILYIKVEMYVCPNTYLICLYDENRDIYFI
jgi:hypothetical protein